jgi:prepilin-type N-terminal cleavage/methylation domain-containing protein
MKVRQHGRTFAGFTVIELLVVLAAIALLLSVAAPRYLQHLDTAREVALKEDLHQLRDAIDSSTATRRAIRLRWTTWWPSATCARCPRIPSRSAATAGSWLYRVTAHWVPYSTCAAVRRAKPAMGAAMKPGDRNGQGGYTLVAALVLLALCMTGLAVAGPMWSQQVRREREQELIRVGTRYAQALASYRDSSPGSLKQFPLRLNDLLVDTRFVGVARHMRKLYADPVSPGQPWGLVQDIEGRITGVFSLSGDAPLAEREIDIGVAVLPIAKRYSDWKFTVKAPT